MQVLLLEDVDNLGLAGDITKVAPGYGRNYLIPQKLAILATPGAVKQADAIRKAGELRRAREKTDAEAIANQISDQVFVFERRAGDRGQLYGSVTAAEIASAITDKFGIDIDRRKIRLPEPIRALGEWDVPIRLMVEVSTNIRVVVIGEGEVYKLPGEMQEAAKKDAGSSEVTEGPDDTSDDTGAEVEETTTSAEVAQS